MQHGNDPHQLGSTPSGHDGPFLKSHGLFGRRRDGRGVQAQTEVRSTRQASTTPAYQGRPANVGSVLGRLRTIAVLIAIVAFILPKLIGGQGDTFEQPGSVNTVPDIPVAPIASGTQGSYGVEVVQVNRTIATLRGADGGSYRWRVGSPGVFAVLRDHQGENVLVYWRRGAQGISIVGVTAPRGGVAPPAGF